MTKPNLNDLTNEELLKLAKAKLERSSGAYSHELLVAVQQLATLKNPRQALFAYLLADNFQPQTER